MQLIFVGNQSQVFTISTTGAGSFPVPAHNYLEVELWGAGGEGENSGGTNGGSGGASTWDFGSANQMIANGGQGGADPGGAGGTASGGDTNTTGGAGGTPAGGSSPNGGAGGAAAGNNGVVPGGGGAGASGSQGGGGGGYSKKRFEAGAYAPGSSVPCSVGLGANTGLISGFGANGRIVVTVG